MRFWFTGLGTSQFREGERVETIVLGKIVIEDNKLNIIVNDNEKYVFEK
jgi:hypothetical protein